MYALVSVAPVPANPSVGQQVGTILYGSFTAPAQAGASSYDSSAAFTSGLLTQTGVGEYPNNPTTFGYTEVTVGGTTLWKLQQVTDPTGAYTRFNWLASGFVVKYGVWHVTGSSTKDIAHTFSYSFAPVDTQVLVDANGTQLWSKQFYYSLDQSEGLTKNSDNGSATFQCPNLCEFDTNELADRVAPANNWFDPLFNSTEHKHDNDVTPGTSYTTGNVSLDIRTQTFSVFEITNFADGSVVRVMQTYDALQRLASTQTLLNTHLVSNVAYTYPVAVDQLGYHQTYTSYRSLPPNFDQPTSVATTACPRFNGAPWGNASPPPTLTQTYGYDLYGNQVTGTAASGVSQSFQYASGFSLPCGINPYVSASTSTPSASRTVGALTLQPAQFLSASGPIQSVTGNTNRTTYALVDGCLRPTTMTTTASSEPGPLTRTYGYDGSGRVATITESGNGFSTTQTMTYGTDAQGHQTIQTSTSYAGGSGPSLPTAQTIDHLGRTLCATDAQGRVTNYQYDSLGRLIQKSELANLPQAQQLVTSYSYGLGHGGSSVTMTTPMGATLSYQFDSLGRQTTSALQAVGDTAPHTVRSFAYDPACFGQLVSAATDIAPGASVSTAYYTRRKRVFGF